MLKRILQGRVLGHPLHPMLVHLPIGLLLVSFLLDVAAISETLGPNGFVRPSFYAMSFGVLAALLAAVPGLSDYKEIRKDHPAKRVAMQHMVLNFTVMAIYLVNIAIRRPNLNQSQLGVLPFVLSLVGIGLLSWSGYLGGCLVYDNGIGVGRHRRRGRSPRHTMTFSAATDGHDGYVTVAEDRLLHDDQSIRVDINGVVMAIARVDGQLFAFQEFCTHRYGPLSEGCFRRDAEGATQVVCPWHGSCFDLKTGAVVTGPAKEEIRVFPIVVKDGQVMVRVPEA
jgi:nitrite reductase/ring-hydroxylating ferredoxin subunit/uncharacterized membrane protein